jgi:hypothetical protein
MIRHLRHQLPALASLGGAALAGVRRGSHALAHPEVTRTIARIDPTLVRDYVGHVGGDPAAYRTTIPPHLFPHWGLPLAARALAGLRYPLARAINAACRLEINAPLFCPLEARAKLVSIDDDGTRVALTQRVITGTVEHDNAVVATIRAVVPLAPRTRRAFVRIPYDARERARWRLERDAGLAFALLTGDFNPIHWIDHAGAAAGFGGSILHGFSIFARAIEGLRFASARVWDAKFTRPLRIPAEVSLFARDNDAWVGDAPGGTPYLVMRRFD